MNKKTDGKAPHDMMTMPEGRAAASVLGTHKAELNHPRCLK